MKRTSRQLAILVGLSILFGLSGRAGAQARPGIPVTWSVYTAPDGGEIIYNNQPEPWVIIAGGRELFRINPEADINDWDKWAAGCVGYVPDSLTYKWTASYGTFPNGSTDSAVWWQAPDEAKSGISVELYFDDLPYPILPGDSGSRDDGCGTPGCWQDIETLETIIPELNTVLYGGGKHPIEDATTPEFHRVDIRDDSAAWTIDADATAAVTFWASKILTRAESNITVRAETSGDDWNIGDWGDNTGNTFGTTWPTGTMICTSEWDIDPDVQWQDYTANWRYKCTNGSNKWIDTVADPDQTTSLYVVLATPWTALSYTEAVYKKSCSSDYCWGLDKTWPGVGDDETVCDTVMDGLDGEYHYIYNCDIQSGRLTYLAGVHGVVSTQHKWARDGGGDPGDVEILRTIAIDTIPTGDGTSVFNWVFHWWVTAADKTFDASANTKFDGAWTEYEDYLFVDYKLYSGTWISNPAGFTAWPQGSITHSNPPAKDPYW